MIWLCQPSLIPHRTRLHTLAISLCILPMLLLMACSGSTLRDPDGDDVRTKARPFSRLGPTEDKLDPAIGDNEDWRLFLADKNATVELKLVHGRFGKTSLLTGTITIYNGVGQRVAEGVIQPGTEMATKIDFPVTAGTSYLVQIKASAGKGDYAVEVGQAADPCAACTDKQTCVEQKCVDKPCGGNCSDSETCEPKSGRCIAVNRCEGVRCPKGQVCSHGTGACMSVKERDSAPKCTANQVLKNGECIEKVSDLDCTIIDIREAGDGAVLTLSAGDNKGVQKGMTGYVKGVKGATFTIVDVYPSRSKAMCKVSAAKLAGITAAAIKR